MSKKANIKKRKKSLDTHTNKKLFSVLAILIVLIISLFFGGFYRYKYVTLKSTVSTYPLQIWQPGEIVNDDRFIFSFNSARSDSKDIPTVWELPPDQVYVIVNVSLKNLTNADYQLSPITSMHIEDDNRNVYNVSSAPFIKDSIGGPVSPDQTVRGEVGFTLPTNVKSGTFIFNPGLPNAHQIRVPFSI